MPALSPAACFSAWPKADAHVFHRVMLVDVQVPLGVDRQIDRRMPGQQREHVVEEPTPVAICETPVPSRFNSSSDVGLGRLAVNLGSSHGSELVARR